MKRVNVKSVKWSANQSITRRPCKCAVVAGKRNTAHVLAVLFDGESRIPVAGPGMTAASVVSTHQENVVSRKSSVLPDRSANAFGFPRSKNAKSPVCVMNDKSSKRRSPTLSAVT